MFSEITAQSTASNGVFEPMIAPEIVSLAQRVAAVPRAERAGVLLAAIARGEAIDLAGADLRGIDLRPGRPVRGEDSVLPSTVTLDGARFAGATLSGACLAHVSLRGACLDGALLVGADLRGADLAGASLKGANLAGADLTRADLSFANLHGATLLTANLVEVTATGSDLRDTVLHAAALSRAILRAADLRWAHLDGANLAGAALDGARFEGATLTLANLAGARLSSSTDFGYAFLHQARVERAGLTRAHLGEGIGEGFTDLRLARETYCALARAFELDGRQADARWARGRACQMFTASHRPDQAWRYYGRAAGLGSRHVSPWRGGFRRAGVTALFYARHASAWFLGHVAALTTGYGTSLKRVVTTIACIWLLFAGLYGLSGTVIDLSGRPAGWLEALRYSAASLTPIDAYPLVATSSLARTAAAMEGIAGIVLLGALGYVLLARQRT